MSPSASNENESSRQPLGLIGVIVLAFGILTVSLWSEPTWQARMPFFAVAIVLSIVSMCALSEAKKHRSPAPTGADGTSLRCESSGTLAALTAVGTILSSTLDTAAGSIK